VLNPQTERRFFVESMQIGRLQPVDSSGIIPLTEQKISSVKTINSEKSIVNDLTICHGLDLNSEQRSNLFNLIQKYRLCFAYNAAEMGWTMEMGLGHTHNRHWK